MPSQPQPPRWNAKEPGTAYAEWLKSPAGLSATGYARIGPVKGGAEALAAARKPKANADRQR